MRAFSSGLLLATLVAAALAGCSGGGAAPADLGRDGGADAPVLQPDAAADGALDTVAQDGPRDASSPELAVDGAAVDGDVVDGADDRDGDGLADAQEQAWASAYFPYYATAPGDKCALHGVLFRLSPHPQDAKLIMIWYVVLYQRDCGALGHVGDDETFGVVVDPSIAPPAGILGVRAISHQGTLCQRITSCGSLPSCSPCTDALRNGKSYPIVFASIDKHGQYVKESVCDQNFLCDFGGCTLSAAPDAPVFVNAGEPTMPLTRNLTTEGFITPQNGWTEKQLHDFDPWGGKDFGGAGSVTGDLTDSAFVIDPQKGC